MFCNRQLDQLSCYSESAIVIARAGAFHHRQWFLLSICSYVKKKYRNTNTESERKLVISYSYYFDRKLVNRYSSLF